MEDQVWVHWVGIGNLAVAGWFMLLAFKTELGAMRINRLGKPPKRFWAPAEVR